MADLTTCYKLLNGLIDIDSDNFFVASNNTRTRGNSRKLQKIHIRVKEASRKSSHESGKSESTRN